MTDETPSHFWRNLGGVLVGIAAVVTAGVAVYEARKDTDDRTTTDDTVSGGTIDNSSADDATPQPPPRCSEPWIWDIERQTCVRTFTIPSKTLSVKTDRQINEVDGRIDFYLNTKRLPGADAQGRAMYESAKGSVQVVVPIMQGTTMVGDTRDVIFSSNEGTICSIASLPEATGHMKAMRVKYFVRLGQCGDVCTTSLTEGNRRVHVDTKPLSVTVAKSC